MSRLRTLFELVRREAEKKYTWISKVRLHLCRKADRDHARSWRQFAHTGHAKLGVYTVCFARAAEKDLTDCEILGMSAHELGHLVGVWGRFPEHTRKRRSTVKTPKAVQDEADMIARKLLGFPIFYNHRSLQELEAP